MNHLCHASQRLDCTTGTTTVPYLCAVDSPLKTIDNGGLNAKFDLCGSYNFYVTVT